ncbi:hypothetical protein [Streptomyces caelestis]|uniref:hypothetical protein n=1 Tax=Streptomyces caelestis TaxID=36816 RepID=UPI00366A02AA
MRETAEEEVVHPFALGALPGGEQVVEDRLAEERAAEETLAALDGMDTGDPKFMPQLLKLREDVREHARAEEHHEFTRIHRSADATDLAAMAEAVKAAEAAEAAEAMAPTRPPPGPTPESSPGPGTWPPARSPRSWTAPRTRCAKPRAGTEPGSAPTPGRPRGTLFVMSVYAQLLMGLVWCSLVGGGGAGHPLPRVRRAGGRPGSR